MKKLFFLAACAVAGIPSAVFASNSVLTILDAKVQYATGTPYLYITWRLDAKTGLAQNSLPQAVSFSPSLNGNFTNGTQTVGSGQNIQVALSKSLDGNATYPFFTWHNGGCNANIDHEGGYVIGSEYVTRMARIFDAAENQYIDAREITAADKLRMTIFDGFDPNGNFSFCNAQGDPPAIIDLEDYAISLAPLEPIVFVPGILGTRLNRASDGEEVWPSIGQLFLSKDSYLDEIQLLSDGKEDSARLMNVSTIIDQIIQFDFYKLIQDSFRNASTTTFFPAGYDWRIDLSSTALVFNQTIQNASHVSPTGKVNIIAHSMGGLLAREYLRTANANLIDKIIFLGTPHFGAPKAAKLLLYGDDMNINFAGLGLNPLEARKIAQNMPAVYELLPSEKYISDSGGYIVDARYNSATGDNPLSFNQTKTFLSQLNAGLVDRADMFHQALDSTPIPSSISAYNIVGCGNQNTIGKITLLDQGHYRLDYMLGDKTVPLESATALSGQDNLFYRSVSHLDLVKDQSVLSQIANIVTEAPDTLASGVATSTSVCASGQSVAFSTHSPVHLHIYDDQNRHLGPNEIGDIEYGIPDSSYDVLGDNNFAVVPEGSYRVVLQAYATGTVSFDISEMSDSAITERISYLNQPLPTASTTATLFFASSSTNFILAFDDEGDGVVDRSILPTNIVTGSNASDGIPPIVTVSSPLDGDEFVRNELVPLSASAADSDSGVALFETKFDNALFASSTIDLFYHPLGNHTLAFLAYDNAGNLREVKQSFLSYADATSTIADIERAFNLGWIAEKGVKNKLVKNIKAIIKLRKKIIKLEGELSPALLKKLTPEQKIKKKIEKLEAKINAILGKKFLSDLEKQYKKGAVSIEAYNLLKEDVEWMMRDERYA